MPHADAEPLERVRTATAEPWWKGAAIYQIYPRSFADSDGDGVGDLRGIAAHLDHVASLGVDCIWISPFYTSPMKDFGYDVADYRGVDPIFGSLADFDAVVARAHALGLKVLIDQVYSHSSDQHPWFVESRSGRDNLKADWYVWADPKPDGAPPNNWQSVFGGPSWTWDARREQYYHHNFLREQPQLDCRHPEVQEALLDITRFWLDRGVDGFRFDAINFMMCDPALRDNPPVPNPVKRTRPFDFQHHIHNQSQPEIALFLERLRGVIDSYGDRFALAEVGGEQALTEMHEYTAGQSRLHSAYGFDYLYAEALTPELVARTVEHWRDAPDVGWPSWAFENHDAPRAVSRWVAPEHREQFARTKMLLLASLRGSIILFQGEELGLTQVDVPFEKLQDPEAIANWPQTLSRDGVRTPMPWRGDARGHGFTRGEPWLPFGPDHARLAVDRQNADPRSQLSFTREVLALRRRTPALRWGRLVIREAAQRQLVFDRSYGGRTVRCTFNLGDAEIPLRRNDGALMTTGLVLADALGPYAALLEEIE
ncbi:MAG: GH13_23 / GH13_40 / GH13_31 / GH13_17 / GH13_ 30 / GH13 / GH13_29 / GH13_35 / GH13_16 / GH13_36 / G H13_20 / GH13_4 / GH13_2 / GH13_1 / GH13_37 [uncultured Sphingomonas sp.]|uniref:GH13_23 / GH13_40 / GH13_31 / GH13_17 / GH13_ 30 / GH13 / GH13_29 / GH13_35 / GH13_16 / GH13_36 / G H13_20 / GH13_4 / GH13_2 / GH13_1 / GH13_37 n=1 Tax=uncultured Sphingomonas sp. TaxID=158754 RepID=A0A6J4TBM5_9SPHN|nr:alpha-glucosidase [uncultured Sphingomonas sp.]CAA9518418.1 MAG: GH13_23 / GH13_40 / GH13_31 / GH13_17 / GH13_ 30 / GH13 / GH13_29 / GH13_35 / GH13_16 / GH13_36 / G H13_20 / GH13_4 / GH13_2 / GH13_1 / GH13_37 [uncultured Sphingomonas sp.]